MYFKALVLGIFIMTHIPTRSQPHYSFYLGGGGMYYYGDLHDKLVIHRKFLESSHFLGVNMDVHRNIRARLNFVHGQVSAADSLQERAALKNRNLSFESKISEASFQLIYAMRKSRIQEKSYPYFFTGVGIFHFNPIAKINGVQHELATLGTEGQYITGTGKSPYNLWQMSIPIGVGVNFTIGDRIDLGLEATYHKTFTDYIDDISTFYPDSILLSSSTYGSAATLFSSRNKTGFPKNGAKRGNENKNDSFVNFGLSISYHLNKRPDYVKVLKLSE